MTVGYDDEPDKPQTEQPDEPGTDPDNPSTPNPDMGKTLIVYCGFTNNVHTIVNDLRTQIEAAFDGCGMAGRH